MMNIKRKSIMAIILCLIMVFAPIFSLMGEVEVKAAEAFTGANGKYQDIEWSITESGHLTVTGQGDFESVPISEIASLSGNFPSWIQYREHILTATVKVTDITTVARMFYGCSNLTSVDLSGLDTSKVIDMNYMFGGCSKLETLDVSGFDTQNVADMDSMFSGCSSLKSLNVSSFDTSKVTRMDFMFEKCSQLSQLNVSNFSTGNVENMQGMFEQCSNLTKLDIKNFNTSKVKYTRFMFNGCENLEELDLGEFNTDSVTDMDYMFAGCSQLKKLDVSGFNTSRVTFMLCMFYNCSQLSKLDVSSFDTSSVIQMYGMFAKCSGLTELDLSHFSTDSLKYAFDDTTNFLENCTSLEYISLPANLPYEIALPQVSGYLWKDETGQVCTKAAKDLNSKMTYTKQMEIDLNGITLDAAKTITLGDTGYISGSLVYEKGTVFTSDQISNEVAKIELASTNQDILKDSALICKAGEVTDHTIPFTITIAPEKEGAVTVIITKGSITGRCDLTIKAKEPENNTDDNTNHNVNNNPENNTNNHPNNNTNTENQNQGMPIVPVQPNPEENVPTPEEPSTQDQTAEPPAQTPNETPAPDQNKPAEPNEPVQPEQPSDPETPNTDSQTLVKKKLTLKKNKMKLKPGKKGKIKIKSKLYTEVTYQSSNKAVAAVNKKGVVTAKKAGKAVITVKANGKTKKVKVTVKKAATKKKIKTIRVTLGKNMKLSKQSVTLKTGTKLIIKKSGSIKGKVTFRSLNKKIVTVSSKGVAKIKKKGKTAIVIKGAKKTVKLKLTVKKK